MNKDVIYIEPEDDITDIISRLKSSEQKVVALVPPKKLGVLRSAVNNKLIAKAAKEVEKAVVMVTVDPSLTKIALGAGLPVAKSLQSRPIMPGDPVSEPEPTPEEEIIEEEDTEDEPAEEEPKPTPAEDEAGITIDGDDDSDTSDEPEKNLKKDKKAKKDIPKFEKYRKRIIIGAVAGVVLICFLVWALVIAPAAKIIVAIKTTATNFVEEVSLVSDNASADPKAGRFSYDKETTKNEVSVDFDATGEKDVGEKAAGALSVSYYFGPDEKGKTISIPANTTFSYNGLNYIATSGGSMTRTSGTKECDNASDSESLADYGCKMSVSIPIQAAESGANYNLDASRTDWASNVNPQLHIINPSAISGGTSKVIKVVQASDIVTAREKLAQKIDNSDLKDRLMKQLSDDYYAIEASYSTDSPDPVASPAVGEEASSGRGTLTATTTATIYGVKKSDVSDYINEVAGSSLPEDQKIYDIGEPFFEKFDGDTLTAKLKTTTHSGPKVTVAEIMEKSKGKKIGEVQSLLRSINGVANVTVEKSVPWMGTIPDDDNKVEVEMTVEDQ